MADAQTISHDGLALIENFEGCKLTAYQDAGGVWTIGYGHTSGAGAPAVHAGMEITQGEASVILSTDLETFEAIVRKHVTVALTQHQFDALVSFVYNLGEPNFAKSTLLKDVNAGNMAGAKAQFARWTRANGVVLQGLIRRRAAEAALFAAPDTTGATASAATKPAVTEAPASSPISEGGVPTDILASLTKGITDLVNGTVGPLLAPAGPSPGADAPSATASTSTEGTPPMNPMLLISIIEQVMTYAPTIERILGNVPDIIAKGQAAIAALEKMDLATAEVDAKAIFADIGITQDQVAAVVSHATKTAPPAHAAA